MYKKLITTTALSALALTLSTAAFADQIINIRSGDGIGSEQYIKFSDSSFGLTVPIRNPHHLWEPNSNHIHDDGNAVWVSYDAETGDPTNTFTPNSPPIMTNNGTYNFYEFFDIDADSNVTFNFNVWADDTAFVYIYDQILFNFILLGPDNPGAISPNFTQNICAEGGIGCQPSEFGHYGDTMHLTAGSYTLLFGVYQIGGGPFGLLYDGTITAIADDIETPSPEATGLMLGALGLMGFAALRRK